MNNIYYNYIYLDPRKPGKFCYNSVCFLYEPFYVGKGKNNRYLNHLKLDKRNTLKNNVIKKIMNESHNLENFIVILYKNSSEEQAFENEKSLIKEIGQRIKNSGALCNLSDGGKGSDTISFHPNRDIIIKKCGRSGDEHWAFHKTYEEIYGNESLKQKEKRSKTLKGIKFTEERRKNISKSLKGNTPWNKGLKKDDPRVLSNIENRIPRKHLKKYIIKDVNNETIYTFYGKKELKDFIKQQNENRKKGNKINIDILISEMKNRNLLIIKKELIYGSKKSHS